MSFFFYLVLSVFLLSAFILCLSILVQESKSMGLGASFGGDPGNSLFGTSTAVVLKKFTTAMGIVFAVLCLVISLWSGVIGGVSSYQVPTIEETSGE